MKKADILQEKREISSHPLGRTVRPDISGTNSINLPKSSSDISLIIN